MSTKKRRMGIAQDGKKVQVLSSYGLLNTKYAECKQQNVELVQIRDLLLRELEGIKEKKKGLLEIAQNGNERTALSSYAVLQTKYAVSSKEKVDLIQMIGKLRGELEDFNRNEEEDINYKKEEYNKSLTQTVVNVRKELDDMKETNEQLREGKAACFRDMEELRGKISKLSDAHELLVEENESLKRRLEYFEVGLVGQRRMERDTRKAVSRAFGWNPLKVDPTLLRAACGFWAGTVECSQTCGENKEDVVEPRSSLKRRIEIWTNLTCHGFQGRVMETLEKEFFKRKKFNVVEICRKSDVDSQFNAVALQSMANCESGKKKYARGLLCSDTTLRRMQKKVHKLAEGLGFSSLPTEEKGNVWCWGDSKGNFTTAVNRYVYEIYVKARCESVTMEKPWQLSVTGDLARVNFRGKCITMAGPKLVDPRLACQEKTGKTSNQSREMYTPAVAGYVDEGHILSYFNALVAAFRQIEAQGYCMVNGVRHTVYIDVSVVADMAFLHKYLGRGGGSHACTQFCFLCSVSRKFRQEGYPGGCLKCRSKGIVYDVTTGCQQCRHHDECTQEFLEWQKRRAQYLEDNVKPRIPKCARAFYEDLSGLRAECLKRCRSDRERDIVSKKKSISALETWLKSDGRTRGTTLLFVYCI